MELLLIGVLLGIPGSMLAAWGYDTLTNMNRTKKYKINIKGEWAEYIRDSKGRQYSFGKIYFDKRRKIWAFDGTNYRSNGDAFCHWQTVTSYIDFEASQYLYTFKALVEGQLDQVYYGFGVVHLVPNEANELVPTNGYYVSATIDGAGMSHSMIPCREIVYGRGNIGAAVVAFIKRANRKQG